MNRFSTEKSYIVSLTVLFSVQLDDWYEQTFVAQSLKVRLVGGIKK